MKTRKTSMTRLALVGAASLLAVGMSVSAMAQDQTRDKTQDQTRDQDRDRLQDPIYGSQLMTLQERNEYQAKMRGLKTAQEREAYRLEHHKQMQERAKVRGVTLPETPPGQRPVMGSGPGAGPGSGAGMGAGAGGGMGGGAGPGGKK
ncbi:MAG: hypothetical protein GZ093_06430 [Rhodoferax sp.]|uniref:hypothetical protein n=1 Tax=Rhodoferax sp. TaxID=50421 RepID=UPI0013FEFA62|nr:hypothetical protein [Rhodoferax sp.]NDP38373.1 hypothetical protein [Rhodoferax sp.]